MEKPFAHGEFSDGDFERAFGAGTFPPVAFTHEAHLWLAWLLLKQYGRDRAVEQVCEQIRAFTIRNGAAGKYHHTLTRAAVRLVWDCMQASQATDFETLLKAYPSLTADFREMLRVHYSETRLFSEQARTEYLEPDRESFNY